MTYDLRARPLLVVLLLTVLAAGAGLFALKQGRRTSDSGSGSPVPAATAPKAPTARPRAAAPARPKPRKAVAPSGQLPARIRQAFADERVVVVALYDPRASIDTTAMREAEAGAQQAGSAFVPVDVRTNSVDSLNARYGVLHDPAVLVLRPPGSLVVRIDGFADRATVAQAAVNAAS